MVQKRKLKFVNQTPASKLGNTRMQLYEFVSFEPVVKLSQPARKHKGGHPKRQHDSTSTMHTSINSRACSCSTILSGASSGSGALSNNNNKLCQLTGKLVNNEIMFIDVTKKYTKNRPHISHPPVHTF